MKINTLLERVDENLKFLTEMSEHELKVILTALKKEFKKYGLRMYLTKHFADYALKSKSKDRKSVSATDVYKTMMEFFKKQGQNFPKWMKNKKELTVAVTNERTGLTINFALNYHETPANTSTPHTVAMQSIIRRHDYRADNNPTDVWIKVYV